MNDPLLADLRHEFRRYKDLADRALASLDDERFFRRPGEAVNPVALIVKHMAGNLRSRWSEFLTTDGEKLTRDRDGEFILTDTDTRASLAEAWEAGWSTLFATLDRLIPDDLDRTITIRGEPQSARQALIRGLTHAAYHVGQITYFARLHQPAAPWLTIAPGESRAHVGSYRAGASSAPAT